MPTLRAPRPPAPRPAAPRILWRTLLTLLLEGAVSALTAVAAVAAVRWTCS